MIPDELFDQIPNAYTDRLAAINSKYLQRMAGRIGKIGRLSSADIHRLDQLRRYGSDYDEMVSELLQRFGEDCRNARQAADSLC
jgi:hypothetical protein